MYHRDWLYLNETRHQMRLKWAEFFNDWDLLLCPAGGDRRVPAQPAGRALGAHGHGQRQAAAIHHPDVLGRLFRHVLPASTVAPAGRTPEGLPVGVQIVGPQYGDLTCIAFAQLLEREYQGFVAPAGYD